MSSHLHKEHHFTSSERVRDIIIGMADGLTVPFALAAGLSGAIVSSGIIITAGLAEIAAGSIAMGLGGYLAAKSDAEHYANEYAREQREIVEKPEMEKQEVREIFDSYGLLSQESREVVEALSKRPEAWVHFMMRFELGLEKPEPKRALISAFTIAVSYIVGGLIPLAPYVFAASSSIALKFSIVVTVVALGVFGYIKGFFTGMSPMRSAVQTVVVGSLAAAAAFTIAKLIS